MIKACVIGWPISHSRSPLIHGYWLRQHGIDGSYTRQPVEPEALPAFIASLADEGYAGCNVTLPHKESVFRLVTPADESPRPLVEAPSFPPGPRPRPRGRRLRGWAAAGWAGSPWDLQGVCLPPGDARR